MCSPIELAPLNSSRRLPHSSVATRADPRDKPDWALVAAILWELESNPHFRNSAELIKVRRLYDAGEIDAAFNLLGGVFAFSPHPDGRLR